MLLDVKLVFSLPKGLNICRMNTFYMSFVVYREIKGKKYYSKVESYRVGDKVKRRILEYYGTVDPRKNSEVRPLIKKSVDRTFSFGDIALLYKAANEINLFEVIDTYVPKRQGLPLSLEFFLTAAHKLLEDKPSSANLSPWVEDTHLPSLLGFDPKRITENTQQYLMGKIYDEERNIDHLYRISIDLYKNALKLFGKDDDTYFYDITSTYFEGKCCPLAFFGHNKDGKLDKLQINIAMIMNGAYGIPIVSKVFKGNINDVNTLYEMVYYPKVIMRKDKCLLIMDRGFDSKDNIKLMDTTKYDYIIGLRSTHKFVKKLKGETDFSTDNWDVISRDGDEIKLRRVVKNLFGKRRNVILYYSLKVASEQGAAREFRIANAIKRLKDQSGLTMKKTEKIVRRVRKYIVLEQHSKKISWRVDKIAVNRARRNDGKFCVMTNRNISPKDTFTLYFSKDKIEKGFRHMKQDANIRPIYKRLADYVIVDVFICHVAYLLLRVVEHLAQDKNIEKSWDELSSEAGKIRLVRLRGNSGGSAQFQMITNNEIQKNIADRLDLQTQTPVPSTLSKTSSET